MARRAYKSPRFEIKNRHIYAGIATAYVGNWTQKKVRDRRRIQKHQYIWHRPNGEKVPLLGFDERQVATLRPALEHVDRNLKPSVRVNINRISRESSVPFLGYGAAALYVSPQEDLMKGQRFAEKGTTKGAKKPTRGVKYFSRRAGTTETKGALRVVPQFTEYKKTGTLFNRGHEGAPRNSRVNPQGILIHEIGHAVGNPHVYNPSFHKAFDWKVEKSKIGSKTIHEIKRSKEYNKGAYHRTLPEEDIAETFRYALKSPMYVGKRKQNKYPVTKEKGKFKVRYTHGREHYMNKHFVRGVATKEKVRITPTSGHPYRVKKRKKTR